ncbi:MAG: Smr/MutS family protein [Nitrospinota bacterium]
MAERLGMPGEVVERARKLAQGSDPQAQTWTKRLEERERRVQGLERELDRARETLAAERAKLGEEKDRLIEQRDRFRQKAERFLREARLEVRRLEREARGAGLAPPEARVEMKRRARSAVASLEGFRAEVLAEAPPVERPPVERRPVRPGDLVRWVSPGWTGVVAGEKSDRGKWRVDAGGKRVWLAEGDLVVLGRGEEEASREGRVTLERPEAPARAADQEPGMELYLLGQRVEEALARVSKYLDEVAVCGMPFIRIVHGKGTGALRRAVAEALEGHPLVKNYFTAEPESGGDGVTVVEMAGT